MLYRILILLLFSGVAQAQSHLQYIMFMDEDAFQYEVREMDDRFRIQDEEHYSDLQLFIDELCQDLSDLPSGKKQILFYVHGLWGNKSFVFNKSYTNMYKHFVSNEDSDIACIVSIKWPSNDMDYKKNKKLVHSLAPRSSEMLSVFFEDFNACMKEYGNDEMQINMIAHSMGNELIKEALKSMDLSKQQTPLINQMIWAAPDLDRDVFFEEGSPMGRIDSFARRNHFYFNTRDLPLEISKQINKTDRLGLDGKPDALTVPSNTYFVDVSFIRDEDNIPDLVSGHNYYRSSPQIMEDMYHVLLNYEVSDFDQRQKTKENNVYSLISEKE